MLRTDAFGQRPFRLAFAFALAVAAATIGAFALIYFVVAREDVSRISLILTEEARLNGDATEARLRDALAARQMREIRRIDYLALFNPQGGQIFGNIDALPPVAVNGKAHWLGAGEMQAIGGAPVSSILVARRRADGGVIVLGRSLQDAHDVEAILSRALGVAVLPTVAAILAIGGLFARRASRRLAGVHEAITRIMEGHLESRLPAAPEGDEIDRIAHAVNLMLDEIARLLDQLKSVGDNIAHDLRAPLTLARIKLDRALEAAPAATRADLEAALAQLDRATVTIAALLRISEVENGPRERRFRDVDLAAICAQAVEFYEPIADAKSVALTASLSGPVWIRGDEDLLREAIANLVDNAVKFTPAGGTVQVAACGDEATPCVEVRDSGCGVPPAERDLIFRRFYRAAAEEGGAGHGLGLSIARNIAELHGLELRVEDNAPGARFVMRATAKASLTRGMSRKAARAPSSKII
ncbi:MAG: HAMP domain-containing protein [Pseudomonadota bacterium]|nr:HAMP domain-containing protein [Pseudomonadota bacterium]